MPAVLFYVFAVAAVATALMVISSRNAVYSALYLIGTLFSLACIFLLLHAEFLAAVQVLVYAGAIMVLFLFVIMLLNVGGERRTPIKLKGQKVAGLVFSLGLLVFLFVRTRGIPDLDPIGPFSPERLVFSTFTKSSIVASSMWFSAVWRFATHSRVAAVVSSNARAVSAESCATCPVLRQLETISIHGVVSSATEP